MASEKQIKARKRNFVIFILVGMLTNIKRIKSESNYDPEFNLAIDQIQIALDVILTGNSSAWNWKSANGNTMAVQNMTKEHIGSCINLLERKMIFTTPKERALWLLIFRTEIIKRNINQ